MLFFYKNNMNIQSYYTKGEQPLLLQGLTGTLEAILQCPENPRLDYLAILGHPHSLYGGTMHNKVVTTLSRAFQDINIPSVRFNFRGVGQSQGVYDAGIGESEDMLSLMKQFQQDTPNLHFCLAGFSFGSYVAYRAAAQATEMVQSLISIAPAVQHYDFSEFNVFKHHAIRHWGIIQGEADDTALPEAVYAWYAQLNPKPTLIKMPETGHFFHSRLGELKNHLLTLMKESNLVFKSYTM